jgi:hypothetical protein
MAKVEADTALKQAEGQRKMMEAQAKAQGDQGKLQLEMIKLQQAATDGNIKSQEAQIKSQEAQARVDMMKAQTMKLLTEAGVMLSEQQLNEFTSLADIELRQSGQASAAMGEGGEMEDDDETPKPQPVTANTVMEGLAMLGQMMQQQSALLARIEAAQTAPTEIVRGPDGRAIGARKVLQ